MLFSVIYTVVMNHKRYKKAVDVIAYKPKLLCSAEDLLAEHKKVLAEMRIIVEQTGEPKHTKDLRTDTMLDILHDAVEKGKKNA